METASLTKEPELKFCKDCAHLLGRRTYQDKGDEWKCGAPQNEKGINLVTGDKTYNIILCKDLRTITFFNTEACGKEGKWYQEYIKLDPPNFAPIAPAKVALKNLSLDDL